MRKLPIVMMISGSKRWPHSKVFATIAFACVDDKHFGELNQHRWFLLNGYPARSKINGKVYLHHEVARLENLPNKDEIDHWDRDRLNAQVENLRPASYAENHANSGLYSASTTGFKGVSWNISHGKFQAYVRDGKGKKAFAGMHHNAAVAALAYDQKAIELFGEFARTNQMLNLVLRVEN